MSVLFSSASRLFAGRFSHRCIAWFRRRGRRANPASRSRRQRAERKAETDAAPGRAAPAPAPRRRRRFRRRRSSTPRPTRSIRRAATSTRPSARPPTHQPATIHALPGGDNPGRKNPVAGPWGVAGFRRQRPPSCPQRPRQRPISHQRRDAARRPDRLRQHSRHQLIGTSRSSSAPAGRIWSAHRRPRRHHDPRRYFQ